MSVRIFPVIALLCLFGGNADAQPATGASRGGEALFLRYCAACHGKDARGDGPVRTWLVTRPPDLTRIAIRNGGSFPDDRVRSHIDGRGEVAVHGLREMPVWGERFRSDNGAGPRDVRIDVLVDWLRSIQEAE